jgi:hypothetical protein
MAGRGFSRREVLGAGLLGGAALASGCRLLGGGDGEPLVEEILQLHGRATDDVYGVDNAEPEGAAGRGDRDLVAPKPWREDPPERPGNLYRQQVAAAALVGRAVGLTLKGGAHKAEPPVVDGARLGRALADVERLRGFAAALGDQGGLERKLALEFHLSRNQSTKLHDSPFLTGLVATTGRERVAWPADANAPDYRHLDYDGALPETFTLTPALLGRLAELNGFDVSPARLSGLNEVPAQQHRKLLFGLRGCQIVTQKGGHPVLRETRPDHRTYRCLLGVWDRADDSIRVFTGSTVPNAVYMRECLDEFRRLGQLGRRSCNALATGLYRYHVGPHKKRPGAFRQSAPVALWRTTDDLKFEIGDYFEIGTEEVCDNIHAGAFKQVASGWPEFGSAGCQVLRGNYLAAASAYEEFRGAAGLKVRHDPAQNGRRFLYQLLTGRDARLVSHLSAQRQTDWAVFERLRFGSTGPRVAAFKSRLRQTGCFTGEPDETLDGPALTALVRWQRAMAATQYRDIRPDAIVKPRDLLVMGVHAGAPCGPASAPATP